jgi:hypothetical protein
VPLLPGLPNPGNDQPLPSISDLVHLTRFSLSSRDPNLIIDAEATIVNPVPPIITSTFPPLPFVISVPPQLDTAEEPIPLASVTAEPFTLTHPNITLFLHGSVLPITRSAVPALSSLISDYLSGIDHPISITSPFELLSSYTAHTKFPAPHPLPEVLRNVTIEDMNIRASGTTILASGTVHARIALPEGMDVTLVINRLHPDALIFDGPLSTTASPPPASLPLIRVTSSVAKHQPAAPATDNDDDDDVPPAPPLPSPLPPRAFARVRPSVWLPTMSAPTTPRRDWNERANTTLSITAWFSDVPFEVLPGREREFRNFVTKVIFGAGDGAVAGIDGVAAVGVRVDGLSIGQEADADGDKDRDAVMVGGERRAEGEGSSGSGAGIVLTGLPFHGSLRVGKKGTHWN